jgi:hypothetical protein
MRFKVQLEIHPTSAIVIKTMGDVKETMFVLKGIRSVINLGYNFLLPTRSHPPFSHFAQFPRSKRTRE